jgi:hypothetical protein
MQGRGIHAVPYINGRLFDFHANKPGNDTVGHPWTCNASVEVWHAENASAYACGMGVGRGSYAPYFSNSGFYAESYNDRVFAVMDPATDYWQQKISDLVQQIAVGYDSDGVYIDQMSMYPELCLQSGTGGGGSRWSDGVRKILSESKRKAGKGKIVISETNLESQVGVVASSMALYNYDMSCGWVPAFQAVCE